MTTRKYHHDVECIIQRAERFKNFINIADSASFLRDDQRAALAESQWLAESLIDAVKLLELIQKCLEGGSMVHGRIEPLLAKIAGKE